MNMTIGCHIPGASQPKEQVRLIDADDVMQNVLDEIRYKESLYTSTVRRITQKAIDAAPTIDPESLRPTAQWVEAPDEGADGSWEACSRCAWESRWAASQYKYCPHCGARMVNADD